MRGPWNQGGELLWGVDVFVAMANAKVHLTSLANLGTSTAYECHPLGRKLVGPWTMADCRARLLSMLASTLATLCGTSVSSCEQGATRCWFSLAFDEPVRSSFGLLADLLSRSGVHMERAQDIAFLR